MIYKNNDNTFCASSNNTWIPGIYADERAAKYAFRFSNQELQNLQNEKNKSEGIITFSDLQKLRKTKNSSSIKKIKVIVKENLFKTNSCQKCLVKINKINEQN